jgi:4-carboxymuconolactone decarboxylase
MADDLKERTQKIASLYFEGVQGERPYELWRSFDPGLARELSVFITGQLYAREKIPHTTRQLVTVAALTVLERIDELKIHIRLRLTGCTEGGCGSHLSNGDLGSP